MKYMIALLIAVNAAFLFCFLSYGYFYEKQLDLYKKCSFGITVSIDGIEQLSTADGVLTYGSGIEYESPEGHMIVIKVSQGKNEYTD